MSHSPNHSDHSGPSESPIKHILPNEGPYATYAGEASSGLVLEYICFAAPGRIRYLKEHGIHITAHLDCSRGEVPEGTYYRFNMLSPYIKALVAISDDEFANPPRLTQGSAQEARHALFNGDFENTEWMQYVQLEDEYPSAS